MGAFSLKNLEDFVPYSLTTRVAKSSISFRPFNKRLESVYHSSTIYIQVATSHAKMVTLDGGHAASSGDGDNGRDDDWKRQGDHIHDDLFAAIKRISRMKACDACREYVSLMEHWPLLVLTFGNRKGLRCKFGQRCTRCEIMELVCTYSDWQSDAEKRQIEQDKKLAALELERIQHSPQLARRPPPPTIHSQPAICMNPAGSRRSAPLANTSSQTEHSGPLTSISLVRPAMGPRPLDSHQPAGLLRSPTPTASIQPATGPGTSSAPPLQLAQPRIRTRPAFSHHDSTAFVQMMPQTRNPLRIESHRPPVQQQ